MLNIILRTLVLIYIAYNITCKMGKVIPVIPILYKMVSISFPFQTLQEVSYPLSTSWLELSCNQL